ncbi:uncharacterized protein LOC103715568 [Phoenix dactylifera]|uniref:Uncharacterized protein LOC103715568 n=1 Tax=Phoenix dactylifera TaxID=42345 RepID=A0A8B9A958_PHODC|nr:uncharacterized protein LOC103715568 [Phoenix dactylifera]
MSESETYVVATLSSSSGQPEDKQDPSQCPRRRLPGWEGNESNTLLVVATLITALTYQVGTNIPGGCWQDDKVGDHTAGDPIMRDRHRKRYWLFMTASWMGFGSSMLMTVYLLTGVPVNSRRVRWPFVVAYSSLMLTFITSQPRTSLVMDLALWVCLLLFLWVAISFKNLEERFCWRASFDRMKNSFKGYC